MITELHTQPHPQQTTTNHNSTDYTQQQQQQTNNHNADNVRSITDSKKHGHQPNACFTRASISALAVMARKRKRATRVERVRAVWDASDSDEKAMDVERAFMVGETITHLRTKRKRTKTMAKTV